MRAVSLEVADGKVITLMPFDAVDVRNGQRVSEGAALGTLARDGDISSAETHVHMGYKRGREYFDPMLLFGVIAFASSNEQREANALSSAATSMLDASAAAEAVGESTYASEIAEVPAAEASPSYVLQGQPQQGSMSTTIGEPSFGTIETGSYVQRQRLQQGSTPLSVISDAWEALGAACSLQFDSLVEALSSTAEALHVPTPLLFTGAATLAIGAAVFLSVVGFKLVVPRVQQLLKARRNAVACRSN